MEKSHIVSVFVKAYQVCHYLTDFMSWLVNMHIMITLSKKNSGNSEMSSRLAYKAPRKSGALRVNIITNVYNLLIGI